MPIPKLARTRRFFRILILPLTFAAITLGLSISSPAQTETVLYSFPGSGSLSNPSFPNGIIRDASGNFYGTTQEGGATDQGSVYELSPIAGGGWQETTLYSFTDRSDGAYPASALAMDATGNLYGESGSGPSSPGSGVIFELSPSGGGGWHFTTIYAFRSSIDGGGPVGGVVLDSAGNLYGTTTYFGSALKQGTVFKLSPVSGGGWHFKLLHTFGADGGTPYSALVLDSAGNLYGTATRGGVPGCYLNLGCGVVYQLSPSISGAWHYTVLHAFDGTDGATPVAAVTFDTAGNLYGTTTAGGAHNLGTVFKLSPLTGGGWQESILHSFTGGADGSDPNGGLIFDSLGNIYGTSYVGADATTCYSPGCGVVLKFSPVSGGGWTATVLHTFTGPDGARPASALIFDPSGNLYGTTYIGGANFAGTIFEITP
jgi:uncharacterized repeat protein (TIGR03803 family)